ncbi:MerR family transcriptional regulator [Cedecea davisae]|uniref:MerR family transcriptional regulator n=1 Tax=Cedecea davisae TaxID=158484 RepID=A0ABS6DHB4_9ENTR|nr:MerR family transcriptional regulator [Cedecea davisae]MBU4682603.1 MerR family transcriptional regulator [Cedecea davisae]MBU4687567.1 MerR family transcriptional regulator [Cedecea davisae]
MLFKVGELAKRAGITVRTLHHYEAMGLLLPSARTAAGYRLYNRQDITRLHHIQALSRMGMSLSEVRDCLESQGVSLNEIIDSQISMLDGQLAEITTLRQRLVSLRETLSRGAEPDLGEWLTTLELMTMYDRYFSKEELGRLPFAQPDSDRDEEWKQVVAEVAALRQQNVPPEDKRAQQLAARWMEMLVRDTAGEPDFLVRLNAMHQVEPEMSKQTGITAEMTSYVTRAFGQSKLDIYRRYLDDEEFAFTSSHYFDRMQEWPPLVAAVRQAKEQGVAPSSDEAQRLARRWLELFQSFAGTSPQTQMKFRAAMAQEPELARGTWMTPELLAWLQQAVGIMFQAAGLRSQQGSEPAATGGGREGKAK